LLQIPGQQGAPVDGGAASGGEVRREVDVMEAAGFEEGEKGGGDKGAAARFGAEIVIAADDGPAEGALGGVVVEWDRRVFEEARVNGRSISTKNDLIGRGGDNLRRQHGRA
jgi:hypothetical protein